VKFPNLPYSAREWAKLCDVYYGILERAVRHAEKLGVTITLKPHTGITANAKTCMEVVKRLPSEWLKICWDAGNVSFYEGIYPDPDLPDLAPHVKSVCIKDHLGGRAAANFPVPGQGQIDHDQMFKILFGAGFDGSIALERVDGTDKAAEMAPELIDERITAARAYLVSVLDKYARFVRKICQEEKLKPFDGGQLPAARHLVQDLVSAPFGPPGWKSDLSHGGALGAAINSCIPLVSGPAPRPRYFVSVTLSKLFRSIPSGSAGIAFGFSVTRNVPPPSPAVSETFFTNCATLSGEFREMRYSIPSRRKTPSACSL